ncbi:MAG: helix-turn-helix transcriptional regulator [Cardiobacteriaceae bacterium]|nr:helix-turn-helix transcriptional regulator [Cardiobacteriaceae bacterium]
MMNTLTDNHRVSPELETGIPYEVANLALDNDWSALRAWREHLGLTQAEVAARLGISQSAYSQQENRTRLHKASREKIAAVLGLHPEQLNF